MPPPSDPARLERDQVLIQRIVANDADALGDLIRLYGDWLAEVAFGVLHSTELAQDVVQDVFLRVWDRRDNLQIKSSVAAFLYRAVSNRAIDVVRHERVHHRVKQTLQDDATVSPPVSVNVGTTAIEYEELRSAVDSALQQLPTQTRDIFLMRIEQDMEYPEIAEACGVPVDVAYRQVAKAMKHLVRRLKV